MNRVLCIYHANCCDGMGAAWVVDKAFANTPSDVEYYAANYQQEPPKVFGKDVVIVDFSYKHDVMKSIANDANSVLVIDHHKSAQKELEPLLSAGVIDGIFDMTKSGAMLTWEWYFPNMTPPKLIEHIQDRDLWKFELEGTKEIQAALYSYPMNLDVWNKLICDSNIVRLINEGVPIIRQQTKNVDGLIEYLSYRTTICGYSVMVLNCNYMFASEAGNKMAIEDPFSATYYEYNGKRKYSLRSCAGGIDVSEIAEKFGGGGHEHAAGFTLSLNDLAKLNDGL